MPFKSQAQEKFMNANRSKMEAQGVNVDEWNSASKGKKLPEKAAKKSPPRGAAMHSKVKAGLARAFPK